MREVLAYELSVSLKVDFVIETIDKLIEVKVIVDDWMDYYNHDRYQMDLKKLSPTEYYHYLLTGHYPLPV